MAIFANNDSFINPNTRIVLRCVNYNNRESFFFFFYLFGFGESNKKKIIAYLCIYTSKIPNLRLHYKFFTLVKTGYHIIFSYISIFVIRNLTVPKKWRGKLGQKTNSRSMSVDKKMFKSLHPFHDAFDIKLRKSVCLYVMYLICISTTCPVHFFISFDCRCLHNISH